MTGSGVTGDVSKKKNLRSLDSTDRRLLQLLVANGRMSNHTLAQEAAIADSTAHTRLAALVDAGVIRGFHADVDPVLVGQPFQALIQAQLHSTERAHLREEAARLARCPGVIEVFFLTGTQDLMIRVAAPTMEKLRDFVMDEVNAWSRIGATQTYMVMEHLRGEHPLVSGEGA